MQKLFSDLPISIIEQDVIIGAYDNIIARFEHFGQVLRGILQFMERTPLRELGLSPFWVVEKLDAQPHSR